jgi:hypothetical protein
MTRGIIYIAISDKYRKMAVNSAQSVERNYIGECPRIMILSNYPRELKLSKYIYGCPIKLPAYSPDIATAYLKTKLHKFSPFDETLYLDCDTKAVADISDVWKYCGDNISVAHAFNPLKEDFDYRCNREAVETHRCLSVFGDFTQYNTGVFLFNKSKDTNSIFDAWRKQWHEFRYHENMAFNRLVSYGMTVNQLPAIYNNFYPNRSDDSKIVHYVGWYKKYL